ncbi:MAG: hypothetical protein M3H12_01220, partial [Chromatiales bacterium]
MKVPGPFNKAAFAAGQNSWTTRVKKVQDKVGPLEDSAEKLISEGCLMTETLNEYFSSVFTREEVSSLPIPETKFMDTESDDYLGQLIVTPEMVANKIKT